MTSPSRARMTPTDAPEPTPAVERTEAAIYEIVWGGPRDEDRAPDQDELSDARKVLAAALDVEEMAREAFVAESGQDRDFALRIWFEAPDDQAVKRYWRGIATAQRTHLLGGAA